MKRVKTKQNLLSQSESNKLNYDHWKKPAVWETADTKLRVKITNVQFDRYQLWKKDIRRGKKILSSIEKDFCYNFCYKISLIATGSSFETFAMLSVGDKFCYSGEKTHTKIAIKNFTTFSVFMWQPCHATLSYYQILISFLSYFPINIWRIWYSCGLVLSA